MSLACIASIDQGTSSTRVLLISVSGQILSSHQMEHTQHYPTAGQVEHDALEIWKNVKICLSKAVANIKSEIEIVGIGITNQRETTVIWDRETGVPYHRAIVWNDTRTSGICDRLIHKHGGNADYFREKTGLPIASYFSATKIMCLLETIPGLREDAEKGKALFGTIDSWLMWKLTNGKVHATDVTNASRTMLMNLKSLEWDEEILRELQIPRAMLPRIRPSSGLLGHADTSESAVEEEEEEEERAADMAHYHRYHNVPISGVLGDQQAALFGQICFHKGEAKCTYGTGAFLLMNTGHEIIGSQKGLLTTVAYQLGEKVEGGRGGSGGGSGGGQGKAVYALEGAIAYSGSVIQWLRDNLELIKSAGETESLADSVSDNGGVYFVPAFAGLYAPYWRDDARGVIAGLTAYNTKAHIVRAALEASAYQTIEIINAMNEDAGSRVPLSLLKVDGGGTANGLLMQFQSDLLKIPLIKPKIAETTALGAAFAAGLGIGLWSSLEDIKRLWHREKDWHPRMTSQLRSKYMHHWRKALARSLHWVDHTTFGEDGSVDQSHEDYLADPIVKLLESKPDITTPPTTNTTTTTTATVGVGNDLTAVASKGTQMTPSTTTTATAAMSPTTSTTNLLTVDQHNKDGKKVVIALKSQSKSTLAFLVIIIMLGFLVGVVLAKLLPLPKLLFCSTAVIGAIALLYLNFQFVVEM